MKKSIFQNTDVFLMQDRTEINDGTFSEPKCALQKQTLNNIHYVDLCQNTILYKRHFGVSKKIFS
jgi:hypothetical protein